MEVQEVIPARKSRSYAVLNHSDIPLPCYNYVITSQEAFMKRKICAIGNSRGVSIPVDVLEELNLAVGSDVDIKLNDKRSHIVIEPIRKKKKYPKGVDREFVSQVNDFIEKYEPALKELAKK